MASAHEEWNWDTTTYYAAVGACEKRGQLDQEWRPVLEMAFTQVLLSTTPFNAAVSACEKVGRFFQAVAHVNSDSITCKAAVSV